MTDDDPTEDYQMWMPDGETEEWDSCGCVLRYGETRYVRDEETGVTRLEQHGTTFTRCPMHEAAKEMLRALTEAAKLIHWDNPDCQRIPLIRCVRPICRTSRELIKRARGETE